MMRQEDPAGGPLKDPVPLPAVAEQPVETPLPRRSHLVAIVVRRLAAGEPAEPGMTFRERYWNPHERRWVEADYTTMEALRRRHIEEEGWELLQEQQLDTPDAVELIFKGHRIDFTRPSREQILRDFGMTPEDVSELMGHVDREKQGE